MIKTNLLALTICAVFLFAGCGKNEIKTAENKQIKRVINLIIN